MSDDTDRLMRLIDAATDPGWDEECGSREECEPVRVLANQERLAAAVGALAFLMLRRDDEMWDAWSRY